MRDTVFLSFETENWMWLLRHYLNFLCELNFIGQQIFNVWPWTRNCPNLCTYETHQPNKFQFVTDSYFNFYFTFHTTIPSTAKLRQHGALIYCTRCARTTKHYDQTMILWQNTTVKHCARRTFACPVMTSSFSPVFFRWKISVICSK